MSTRLSKITNWEQRIQAANYCVKTLAANCNISTRQLQRFVRKRWGVAPRVWMSELRQGRGLSLLATAHTLEDIAADLHYSCAENFTRAFRHHYGQPPSQARAEIFQ
jgi:AraC-like DNA-binding protein